MAIHCTPAHGSLGEVGEDPTVGGVGDGVHRRPPDGAVVGAVPARARLAPPPLAVVLGDDDVGSVAADRGREVPTQVQPLDDAPVGVAEELDLGHADDRSAGPLLGLAAPAAASAAAARRCRPRPHVTSTYDTSWPAAVHAATAPAMPHSMSSGWATITVALCQPSGNSASVSAAR